MTPAASTTVTAQADTPLRRFAFRFGCVYLPLYFLPTRLWKPVVPLFGRHVLGISQPIGDAAWAGTDALYNYVLLALLVLVSTLVATVWTLRSKREAYAKGEEVLHIALRFIVGTYMMMYGVTKVFPSQFPMPGPVRLLERYGDSSPAGLLWTFMGYSAAYCVFTGLAEVVGGFLLFFRRTATLGALVNLGVMSNVVMLNFCYDVPVKLGALHLFLFNVVLALPDARRLVDFFVLDRVPRARPEPLVLGFSPRLLRVMRFIKPATIGLVTLGLFGFTGKFFVERGRYAPLPALYGAYEVESFVRGGKTIPPSLEEPTRLRYVAIDRYLDVSFTQMNDQRLSFDAKDDPEKKTLTLTPYEPGVAANAKESKSVPLEYATPDPEHLTLAGRFQGDEVEIRLRRMDASTFTLENRGFRWIQHGMFNP